jgi:hypothetical protein
MSGQKSLKTQVLNTRNLKTRQFDQLISSNNQLNKLYTHAKDICALNEKLHNYLAPTLSSHCSIANYSAETLIVNADTSAWASKLRNRIPDILAYVRHECGLSKLITVRIRVSPKQNNTSQSDLPGNRLNRKASLSKKSAEFIESVAKSIQDPALRESILKISKNAR